MPLHRRRTVVVATSALVLVLATALTVRLQHDSPRPRAVKGSREMAEALEKRPGLARNRMALAFVAEKLEQQGGEGSGEILNGPAQESYDQRAYPRSSVRDTQRQGAVTAYRSASARGRSLAGGTVQRRASGRSAVPSWSLVGPRNGTQARETTYTGTPTYVSGRITALIRGRTCTAKKCELFVGAAGGGVWRTRNAQAANPTWTSVSSSIPSTAIGTLYRAPNGTIFAGTGEGNGSSDSEAGIGLYRSTNDGTSWTRVSTLAGGDDFTIGRSVDAVAVDPKNPRHILVGTAVARHGSSSVNGGRFTPPGAAKVGLYESTDGGSTWRLALSQDSDVVDPTSPNGADFFRGGVSKIGFDPTHRGVAYASMFDYGLFRSDASGEWRQIYTIKTPGAAATSATNRVEFALAKLAGGRTRVYLGDSTYFDNDTAALLRTDDALADKPAFTLLSDPTPGTPGYGSYNFCETQCSYDMVVSSPSGRPDEVFLSGSMNYNELQAFGGRGRSNGRSIVRSADAGVHVTDMTNDAKRDPNGLHPDQHGLVFASTGKSPGKEIFYSASDGGVWRQSGPYVDRSADCGQRGLAGPDRTDCEQYLSAVPSANRSLNKALPTLQFQSVSVDGTLVQGGTQDNGTWESDYQGFAETVGGDGGQSGFDAGDPSIRYHSYYNPSHDVSFDNGSPRSWDYISDPFDEASSFYTPFTADPVTPGTVYDGLQHVWRTQDNGGDRQFLDRYCNELTGDYANRPRPCGDWVKLGGAAGDLSGGDTANYVVAVDRATSDSGTMWAATRKGGVYISSNADAADPAAVTYQRLDQTLGLPKRFVSGIAIDPAKPGHAFISYSGYSAYSPGGHVYEVSVDPATGQGTAKDVSGNLGDQPVTDVVYVPGTSGLYVSTDYGVLARAAGQTNWVATPGLPQVAVYGLTLAADGNTLYAATHGRSVWKLRIAG